MERLKSGDLVFFSGKGLISWVIQIGTWSKWGHVGMVIENEKGLLLWESTTLSDCVDVYTGVAHDGSMTVDLQGRIDSFDGDVAVRRLRVPLSDEQQRVLEATRKEFEGREYEASIYELLSSLLDVREDQKEDLSTLFCSEQSAEAYQRMKIISESKPSNEHTPADLAEDYNDALYPVEVI